MTKYYTCCVVVSIPVDLAFDKKPSPQHMRDCALENFRAHPAFDDLDLLGDYVDHISIEEREE